MTDNFKCNKCTCQLPYFLPCEVSLHNTSKDCWVSYLSSVYDLTELCNLRKGHQGIELIIAHAGKDISHWSYNNAKEHIAFGKSIISSFNDHPFWLDDKYMRGNLTKNARPCRIINVLAGTEAVILVCEEDTVARIQERFLGFNAHGTSYTWKFEGKPIDTYCTLTENGIVDERERFLEAGLPDDTYIPAILCYYNDDLTEQKIFQQEMAVEFYFDTTKRLDKINPYEKLAIMHLLEQCIVITKHVLAESRRMGLRRIKVKPLIFSSKNIEETKSHHTAAVNSKCMKVTVLGAAGPTGTALSLLLKQSSLIDELAVYDRSSMAGLVLELSHIDTRCKVNSCTGAGGIVSEANLKEALQDAKIVMITSEDEAFKKITKNREELLKRNANVISELVPSLTRYCPRAMIALVSRPVNSLIPLLSEMYKKAGFDEDTVQTHLFGVTSLDCVRANKFAAEILGIGPEFVLVPVIGGSCPKTCIPLFSQMKPRSELTNEEIGKLTYSVKMAEEEVAKEYDRKGSSSLAMAFAAARFCISLCKALRDQKGVVECAYVRSCVIPEVTYFAAPLELGPNGVQKHLGIPALSDYECKMLTATIPVLNVAIRMGQTLALGPKGISTETCATPEDPCGNRKVSSSVSDEISRGPISTA